MVVDLLLNILLQLMFTLGAIVIFGLIIALCNICVYKLLGNKSKAFIIATGFIGTPIHELSHAGMCLLFGHKINEIRLFIPDNTDGTLGYVNHSYNRKNVYHVIGNFFIGVAPVIAGTLLLVFLEWLLLRNTFDVTLTSIAAIDPDNFFSTTFTALGAMLGSFFSLSSITSWSWWLFLLLAIPLSLHMDLSPADVKGALPGAALIVLLSVIVNAIVGLINMNASNAMTQGIAIAGVYIVGMMLINLIIALILVAVALIINVISGIIRRKRI